MWVQVTVRVRGPPIQSGFVSGAKSRPSRAFSLAWLTAGIPSPASRPPPHPPKPARSPAPLCRRESEAPSPDLTLPDLISRCPVPALPADSLLLKAKTCSCPGASAQVVPSAWRAVCPLGCPPAAIYYIQLVTSSLGLSRPFHLDLQCSLAPFRSNIMYGLCIYFCCLFSAIRM